METTLAQKCIRLSNILFTTDFSESSEAALPFARAFARHYGATLPLAHVERPEAYLLAPPEAIVVPFEEIRQFARTQMSQLSGRMKDVPHQTVLGQGEIQDVLPEMIEKNKIDWIVLGTHGRTGLRKLLLGSVAEQILRLATVPVLTVGPRIWHAAEEAMKLRDILCAAACLPGTEQAVAYAFALAQEHQAHLTLLHVVESVAPVPPEEKWDFGKTFELLEEMIPPEADLWCDPELLVELGDPVEDVLAMAAGRGVDLIVQGRGPADRCERAIAYKVACRAHCPVLTVPG